MTMSELFLHLEALLEADMAERDSILAGLRDRQPELAAELRGLLDQESEAQVYFEELASTVESRTALELDAGRYLGRRIGPYRVEGHLGSGGMGAVYLASRADGQFERQVALKVMHHVGRDAQQLERFLEERRLMGGFDHQHIARVLDGGVTQDGFPFFAMEHIEGVPIDRYASSRRLDLRERLRLFLQVTSAVEYAHRCLIVHRDLKPSNILVDRHGHCSLIDFGIAQSLSHSQRTNSARTALYCAPEQLTGGHITTATDVYSLGVLLWELIAGRALVEQSVSEAELIETVIHRKSSPPSSQRSGSLVVGSRALARDLDSVCLKALEKNPQLRYGSVRELSEDLRRCLEGRPVAARQATLSYRLSRFLVRRRVPLVVGAGVALIIAMAVAAYLGQTAEARREKERANRMNTLLVDLLMAAAPRSTDRGLEGDPAVRRAELAEVLRNRLAPEDALADARRRDLLPVLGQIYESLGDSDAARLVYEQALAIEVEDEGNEMSETLAGILIPLGSVERRAGNLATAQQHLERVFSWIEAGENGRAGASECCSAEIELRAINELGLLRLEQGRHEDAGVLFERALGLARQMPLELRGRHEAATLSNLAGVRFHSGDFSQAEALHRKVLALRREYFGDESLPVANALHDLASSVARQRRLEEAVSLQKQALVLFEKNYGDRHPLVGQALNNLGGMDLALGRPEVAITHLERALVIRRERLPEFHPEIAQTLSNLGLARQQLGQHESANRLLRQAVEIRRRNDPSAEAMAMTLSNLGYGLVLAGRGVEAEQTLIEALALAETLPDRHPALAATLTNLALAELEQGRTLPDKLTRAEIHARRALELRRAYLTEDHPHLVLTRDTLERIVLARAHQ